MADDDYDYSDSFVSDDDSVRNTKYTKGRQNKRSYTVSNKKGNTYTRGRGGKNMTSRSTSQAEKGDGVVQRMLSAKNIKINELRNQLEDLHTALRDVKEENKLLKKMQHRQEKALNKYEDTESDLPQILSKHQNEVRTLKENLRKTKEKYERTDRYLRDAEDELDKVKSKLKRYKGLADQQNLMERDDLQKRNQQLEIDVEEKDVKIKELERHINNLNKNHRHELGIEIARNRDLQKQLESLRNQKDDLDKVVKEKEKEIQIKNIYANRARAQHRLPASYGGTPHDTPPPRPRKRAPSLHDLTPREKAKMFEEKRREDEKKIREQELAEFQALLDEEQQERARREREEREENDRRRADEQERKERLEWERQERERQERESRERREREQKEKEEEDWRLTMERERLKREQEERDQEMRDKEERLRREREEKDRRERERKEQERRAHEEMERNRMDKQLLEERKKKDDLLAKLKQIDDGSNKLLTTKESQKSEPVDSFFLTSGVKDKDVQSLGSATSSKNSYSFSKPVENLHSGKPSREDNTVPYIEKRKKKEGLDEFGGGYMPSFGETSTQKPAVKKTSNSMMFNDDFSSRSKPKNKDKKSSLLSDLFGNQTSTSKNFDNDDDLFKSTKTTKTSNTNTASKSTFLWEDDDSATTTKKTSGKRENSTSALFGGGNAIIDDDLPQKNNGKMLPRRPRQTTTFASRPAVTAVDHYEDDIEEVIL